MLAAMKSGRNSIGIEIDEEYCKITATRLKKEAKDLFSTYTLEFKKEVNTQIQGPVLHEDETQY